MTSQLMDETAKPTKANAVTAQFSLERMPSLVLRFSNSLKRQGKSRHTLAAYANDLSLFAKFLEESGAHPSSFDLDLPLLWLEYLKKHGRLSEASARRAQMSVRTFIHFLISIEALSQSPFLEVKSPRQPNHNLLIILPEHFQRLQSTLETVAATGDAKATRDLGLVLLLGICGLKATEAASLTWNDCFEEPESGTFHIRGSNERIVPFGPEVATALRYLRQVRAQLALPMDTNARLFFGFYNLTRKIRSSSLHRHGIKFIIYEICNEILGIPYNSESLRNHAIVRWMEQGISDEHVAELAGYSSLNSLERFCLDSRGLRKPARHLPPRTKEATS